MEQQKEHQHESAKELKRVLPLSSLVFYGLAFMVPLTIFTTYGIVTNMTHGMVAITYVITTLCMSFTAFSYVRMTKAYPVAGSVYTYVHKSINPYIGFLSGWVILIGYMFLPMLNYLVSAIFLAAAIPQIPAWVWIVGFIIVVTIVNHFGIQITDIFNRTIVWIQIIFLVALMIIVMKFILGGGGLGTLLDGPSFLNLEELSKEGMGLPILLSGASILALSFLGFDAISTLSEEAINPEKNIGRAILIACIGAGIMFTVITYVLQLAWPAAWFEMIDVDGGSYELINKVAGSIMAYIFTAAYAVGCLASSISSVASASRVLYGMGRDKILPKSVFGYLHIKYQTPTYSILIMGLISLSALFVSLSTAASLLNFGALLGFTMVNLSVVAHYFIKGKKRGGLDVVRYLIAPLCGAAFTFVIWLNLDLTSMALGFGWMAIGLIYLAYTTKMFKELPVEMKLD
ncbi:APC family permease [Sinanaerobacter chloroacetimidivorans]|uniref:APC family permease n=1 Tax=Sinanaerobacter chloroacetimidivorans TaxID=2818044 RepID=A0A8J8B128_9FIRM|nr:APC family permease [Sinanaerobacter chloroacetimidivorans]MBR0597221.1 APC family permease [Sinanaerobacter chloroacetimidivorans]